MSGKGWQNYRALYEASVIPTLFASSELAVFWANNSFSVSYSPQCGPDFLTFLLGSARTKEVLQRLAQKESFELECAVPPFSPAFLVFTPVFDGDSLSWAVIQLLQSSAAGVATPSQDTAQIISTLSSQFRTPLSKIFSSLFNLSRRLDSRADPETSESLDTISINSYRILRSTVNVTEFGKYLHNLSVIHPSCRDLNGFLANLCEDAGSLLHPQGFVLEYCAPKQRILLPFDDGKLSYAFLNLLSNSCRFSPRGSTVRVTLEQKAGQAFIAVTDSGCGISPERLPQIFNPYYSYDPSTGAPCGDGLGLTLVKYIASEHGGAVAVQSEENTGTTVLLRLPLTESETGEIQVEDEPRRRTPSRFSNLYIVLSDICELF